MQAAWRFYANERIRLPTRVEPLRAAARRAAAPARPAWGLVSHDQSALRYPRHSSKADRLTLRRPAPGQGYQLTTALLGDAGSGDPVTPLELRLRAQGRVSSTRTPAP